MCGRFALTLPVDAMVKLFDAAPANNLPDIPNFNICPTTQIVTVASDAGARFLKSMRWGFLPHWYKTPTGGPLLINARAETIAEKPAFRDACRSRRCLVPADGFYEWTKDDTGQRLPWYVHRADRAPMVFAAVWQDWERDGEQFTTCAVVTTAANSDIDHIHHRMPVVLEPESWPLWLGEEGKGAARLMQPAPAGALTAYRVGTEVNSNRARGEQLILPLEG